MSARTAAEVAADIERRMREDPEYRAGHERAGAARAERSGLLRLAEKPVVDDLRAIGVDVATVWDLHKVPDSRPAAIPVLLKHLAMDYPDQVLMGIGVGLDDCSTRAWWSDLSRMMLATDRDVVRDRLAAALSGCAVREHFDDLVAFIRDDSLGASRIYFLRPINRIGNQISTGQGRAVIEAVVDDSVLGKEATAILAGRRSNQ